MVEKNQRTAAKNRSGPSCGVGPGGWPPGSVVKHRLLVRLCFEGSGLNRFSISFLVLVSRADQSNGVIGTSTVFNRPGFLC